MNIQDALNAIDEDGLITAMPKKVLSRILNESYAGHQDGCLYCAEINELVHHSIKYFKPVDKDGMR